MLRAWFSMMMLLSFTIPAAAAPGADDAPNQCVQRKLRAAGSYSACLARADARVEAGHRDTSAACEKMLNRRFRSAERRSECPIEGNVEEVGEFLSDAQSVVSDAVSEGTPLPVVIEPVCDPSQENLADYEIWGREEGYWIGEYTFLGADGNPFVSSGWTYPYDQYMGFIHLELDGPNLSQRNVFLYPPQVAENCTGAVDDNGDPTDVVGDGECGVNGNEKLFSADQQASNCEGGLAGPFVQGPYTLHTETQVLGDDAVVYQVRLFPGGPLLQNQLTSLPGDDTRVRTAQGFNPFLPEGLPTWSYASFYRERKVSRDEFYATLDATRDAYSIREEDHCGFDSSGAPSGVSCEEHFGESTAP
jgi:hypothetical protein